MSVAERWLAFVDERPELSRRSTFDAFFAEVRAATPSVCGVPTEAEDPVQPWPVWIEPELDRELEATSLALARLFRDLPRRVFGGDAGRVAEFLDLDRASVETLLGEPALLGETLCRGDFLLTAEGPKLLEMNFGNLGGWQMSALTERYLARPDIADFLARHALGAGARDSIGELLRHVLGHALAHPLEPGPLHLLVVVSNEGASSFASHPVRRYQRELFAALREIAPGRAARLEVARVGDLSFPGGEVHAGGRRAHAVIEQNDTEPRREIFRAFKAGLVHSYTAPLGVVLGDKRWLALISERAGSGLFTPAETELIARAVPWTREVRDATATFGGESAPLPRLLAEQRERLVLKAGAGYGGEGVHVGRATDPERWRRAIDEALAEPGWIVQEHVEALRPRLQHGEGSAPFHVVWGLLVFGERYGGAYLRLAPESLGPVVNVARGARVGIALTAAPR